MEFVKRFVSILLAICLLLGLVPMVSAAATSLSTVEQAIVETALAYYYKGPSVQYDSYYFGSGSRFLTALLRQTNDRSPESSSPDDIHYTVCSAYPWDVYYNTFADRVIGQQERIDIAPYDDHDFTNLLSKMNYTEDQLGYDYSIECIGRNYGFLANAYAGKDERSVGYWGPSAWDAQGNVTELSSIGVDALEIEKLMRPGDIVTSRPFGTETVNGVTTYVPVGGHTMMYLGDVFGDGVTYVIHSWGSKYDDNGDVAQVGPDGSVIRGFDYLENAYSWRSNGKYVGRNGSIVLTPYKDILGPGKSQDVAKSYDFSIIRPAANKTEADLTPSALFRLDRPGVTVTKTASVKPYRDVVKGDTITYTVKIENNTLDTVNSSYIASGYGAVLPQNRQKTYKDLSLTETLPAGTSLVSASSGYTTSGSKLVWKISSLAPGKSLERTYTVKVTGTGSVVCPEGVLTATGARGSLPTKEISHEIVTQQLPATKASAITVSSVTASDTAKRSGTDSADDVYAAMGYALDLPDGQQMASMILQEVNFVAESTEAFRTDFQMADASALTGAAKTLRQMVVPGFIGGRRLFTTDENYARTNRGRLLQFDEEFLQPGDVLVYLNGGRTSTGSIVRSTAIENTVAYVYLGSSRWAHYVDGVFTVTSDPIKYYYGYETSVKEMEGDGSSYVTNATSGSKKFSYSNILHQSFLQDVFFLLRPSRVGLTTMTASSKAKAVEVKSASGTGWYESLSAAVSAAKSGDTLVLHEDITLSARLGVGKPVTLDMNGYSITGDFDDDLLLFNAAGDSTLKNGSVYGAVYASSSAVLHVENAKLLGQNRTYGAEIVRQGPALMTTGNAKVTLQGVSIASEHTGHAPIQRRDTWTGYSNITVLDDVKIMIPKDVTWDYSTMKLGTGVATYVGQPGGLDGKVASDAYTCLTLTASPDVYNETTKTYYASLSEAIRTMEHGATLRLLRDVDTADYDEIPQNCDTSTGTAKYYFYSKKNFTLNLDGHTIRDNLSSSATFMFRDDSGVSGLSTFTIRGGTLRSKVYGISGGQLVVQDMTIHADWVPIYLAAGGSEGQTALIEDSVIMGGFGGKKTGAALACNRGSALVRGSVLVSNNNETIQAGYTDSGKNYRGIVQLEEAEVYTNIYTYNTNGSTKLGVLADNRIGPATGSTIASVQQLTTYTVDGKAMPFLMDSYVVADGVANINGRQYSTLERALKAARSGDTVQLTASAEVSSTTVKTGVTLDLNKQTVTLKKDAVLTVAGTVTAESGTMNDTAGKVKLEGEGNYLGITIPKGVEGTVFADLSLKPEFNFRVGSALSLDGTVAATYEKAKLLNPADGSFVQEVSDGAFSLGNLAAKDMGKEFSVVLTAETEDATLVGKPQTVSLRSVTEQLLADLDWNKNAAVGRALLAMLNYGAATQKHFGAAADSLVNANVAQYQQYLNFNLEPYRKDSSALTGSKAQLISGTSCILGQDMQIRFRVSEGKGITYDVTVGDKTTTNHTGAYTAEESLFENPTELFIVTVYENGVPVAKGMDSLVSYLNRLYAYGETELADAMLTYVLAVNALS